MTEASETPMSTAGGVRWTYEPAEEVRVHSTWWTAEQALYALLFLFAFVSRFLWIHVRPLSPAEAHQAWLAWHNAHPPLGHQEVFRVSPLAYAWQWLLFFIGGGNDGLARFGSALVGTLLILLPYSLREVIGRRKALFAAFLLTLSAQVVYWSRHATGTILTVASALLLVVLLIRWLRVGHFWEQGKEGRLLPSQVPEADARLRWVAVALALLLTTTPEAYSVLLGLVVALWPLRHTLAQAWHDVGGKARHRAAALFLLLIGAIGSVFLTDIPALGNVADLLGQWVRSWWQSGGYPWYWVPFRVLADEPLLAGLALWGAWRAWRRGNVLDRVWLRWAVVLLLLGFRPGRTSADVVVLLIPLTFLAADALRAGWEMLRAPSPTWREEGVLTAAFLIILVFLSMMFAGYVASGESRYIPALIVVPLLLVGLAFLYGFWLGKRAALRVVFTCALITGLVWTWMAFWVQNLHLAPDAALDALPGIERETTYPDIRLLVRTVERISAERNTDLHEIPLDLMSEGDDVLRWYFRDFKNLREIPSLKSATAPVVLAPTTAGELPNYTGMDWVTRRAVLPTDLGGRIYHWWLYRESAFPQPTTDVVLWYAAETPQGKDGE